MEGSTFSLREWEGSVHAEMIQAMLPDAAQVELSHWLEIWIPNDMQIR